jgi:hypothetical protein
MRTGGWRHGIAGETADMGPTRTELSLLAAAFVVLVCGKFSQ